jgi:acetyl esterase
MALDPDMKLLLDQMAAAKIAAFHTLTPQAAREQMARRPAGGDPVPVASVQNRLIPGPNGEIPIRIYTPEGSGPFGVLVYFHGGGWVLGSLDMTDQPCRMITKASGCITVSVDYRLAPEHKFPAGPEDCYAATKWVSDHAAELNCDASRIAVGGTSAGGTLAAVTALMARDRGAPKIAFQLLVYPATRRELDSPSQRQFAEDGYILSRADMEWFWDHYLVSDADAAHPYACPDRAKSLAGLPPAFVLTAEYDPLRDEGEAFAARLREEGVATVLKRYDGVTHGFFGMPSLLQKSRAAIAEASEVLRDGIGSPR